MNITITGRIPSKKNCKMALPIKGRCMVVNNGAYSKWKKEVQRQLEDLDLNPIVYEKAQITIELFAPDARASDLSNKAESLMDALVDYGVLKDDNWFVCGDLHLKFGGIDRENPRAEIKIL